MLLAGCIILLQGIFAQPSKGSFSFGYGMQGFVFRGDVSLGNFIRSAQNSSTRLYLDCSVDKKLFDDPQLVHNGYAYPSDARVISVGIGATQEFIFKVSIVVSNFPSNGRMDKNMTTYRVLKSFSHKVTLPKSVPKR